MDLNKNEYQQLFETYYNVMCNFCLRYIPDRDLVEDVVQDVFLKLWQRRDSIEINTDIKSYLFTSVKNKAIEYIRSKKRQNALLENIQPEKNISEDLGEEENSIILKEKMLRAIHDLPTKCQEIFVMNKLNGLTYKEIAQDLGLSEKTVDNQMRRAFKLLREKLL